MIPKNNKMRSGGSANNSNQNGFFGSNPQSAMRRDFVRPYTFMGEADFDGAFEGGSYRPKEAKKYPLHSDIQELHDKLQQMYVIGTSLVEQKTVDIMDSQFLTTIPMGMSKIVFKMITFLLLYILFACAINFFLIFAMPKMVEGYSYNPFLILVFIPFCFSLFFYKYFIESMRQYVVEKESVPRTTRFYSIIASFWRVVEAFLVVITIGSLIIYFKSLTIIYYMQTLWAKVGKFLKLQSTMFDRANIITFFGDMAFFLCVLVIIYFAFAFALKRTFARKQKENYITLLIQHNPSRAVREMLDGEC